MKGLRFDSTHEYYFGNARLTYYEDSCSLSIWNDMEDRIIVHGVDMEQLKDFVTRTIPRRQVKPKCARKSKS